MSFALVSLPDITALVHPSKIEDFAFTLFKSDTVIRCHIANGPGPQTPVESHPLLYKALS